jgi:adenylate cyclase
LLDQLARRVVDAGLPLDRLNVYIYSLHPQYMGYRMLWQGEFLGLQYGTHELMNDPVRYIKTPMYAIRNGARFVRRRLESPDCPIDYSVLEELREDGVTDYTMSEMVFCNGERNCVSLTTKRAGGFTDHDIKQAESLLQIFTLVMENLANQSLSVTLLDTYLGRISGQRVLNGSIRRGDGDLIDAVIWFSDLRESTRLAEQLGHEKFMDLLNDYFEATAGSVLANGGEVLRFIGDASLAVFPVDAKQTNTEAACNQALQAAHDSMTKAKEINQTRQQSGRPVFQFGVGLHRGEVMYGNIGTAERLEFSVIGPAANETARIEALSKTTGETLVVSSSVASCLDQPWRSLGQFELRGVGHPMEVFSL